MIEMAIESQRENNMITQLSDDIVLPRMIKVKQIFDESHLAVEDIPRIVNDILDVPKFKDQIKEGMSIAITSGSRGVANIALITKAIVDFVKSCGAHPFVFPAMGSHGGATAEGQLEVLTSYGVTEEYLGCPVRATMETVEVGRLDDGMPAFADKYAFEADGVILCGRVKAHTAFRAPHESGLMKMTVIGMGKQHGAMTVHESGFDNMGKLMPKVAKVIYDHVNVLGGIAIMENAFDQTYKLEALTEDEIWTEEPKLLLEAKSKMGGLLFDELDVLIVDQIGKDISGDGMDPNVTGRFACADSASGGVNVQSIAVLDLTEDTHGNFNGIGMADVTSKRAIDKMNPDATYPNAFTSTVFDVVKIPMFAHSDKTVVKLGIRKCNGIDKKNPRIVRIRDTNHVETIEISEALLQEAKRNPRIQILSEPYEWKFDELGNLF